MTFVLLRVEPKLSLMIESFELGETIISTIFCCPANLFGTFALCDLHKYLTWDQPSYNVTSYSNGSYQLIMPTHSMSSANYTVHYGHLAPHTEYVPYPHHIIPMNKHSDPSPKHAQHCLSSNVLPQHFGINSSFCDWIMGMSTGTERGSRGEGRATVH